ncbi:MAG: beta-hydroxyacyl-ACP dehydratase [Pirellulales bacterium]
MKRSSRKEEKIVCRADFHGDEFFFQGHYPDFPLVPGVILCEAAMQTGAVLLSKFVTEAGGVPVATRMGEVKFKRMVRPGESVIIEVKLNERLANAFFMSARVTCEGKLAASLEFACSLSEVR